MIRAIVLSLILFLGLGAVLPLAVQYSEARNKHNVKNKKKKKKIKKYSKKWWRIYRAKMRKKRALEARKRALRLRRAALAKKMRLAKARAKMAKAETTQNNEATSSVETDGEAKGSKKKVDKNSSKTRPNRVAAGQDNASAMPFGSDTPSGWKGGSNEGEFSISDDEGKQIGKAVLTSLGNSLPEAENNSGTRNRTVGGVPISSLRRTVIDKMLKENGWIVNDYQKEIDGRKVFVVVAQSPGAGSDINSRVFYFTEVDGKIISLATNVPSNLSERLAKDSEKVINLLYRQARSQSATLR